MMLPAAFRLASDAALAAVAGGGFVLLAVLALWGDWRRRNRRAIDAVGWVPWRDLSAVASFAGIVLLAMAAMGWIRG